MKFKRFISSVVSLALFMGVFLGIGWSPYVNAEVDVEASNVDVIDVPNYSSDRTAILMTSTALKTFGNTSSSSSNSFYEFSADEKYDTASYTIGNYLVEGTRFSSSVGLYNDSTLSSLQTPKGTVEISSIVAPVGLTSGKSFVVPKDIYYYSLVEDDDNPLEADEDTGLYPVQEFIPVNDISKAGYRDEGDHIYTYFYVPSSLGVPLSRFMNGLENYKVSNTSTRYHMSLYHVLCVGVGSKCFDGDTHFPNASKVDVVLPTTAQSLGTYKGNTKIRSVSSGGDIETIDASAFEGCTNLEYVNLKNVNLIGNKAFYGCQNFGFDRTSSKGAYNISFPNLQTVGNQVWYNNTSLIDISLGNTLQMLGKEDFRGCVSLRRMDLKGTNDYGFNFINAIPESCFYGCTNLAEVRISDSITEIGNNAFYQCNMGNFKFETTKLKSVGSEAFSNCSGLEYAVLPDTLSSVGKGCFLNCKSLRYVYSDSDVFTGNTKYVTPEYTTLINNGKDRQAPVVSKAGNTTSLDGQQIFGGMEVYIWDSVMDVDPDSIKYYINGEDVTSLYFNADDKFYYTDANETGGTVGYKLRVPYDNFGTYRITAQDILGNLHTTEFKYLTNDKDTTNPVITVKGTTKGKDVYKGGTTVSVTDDLGLASVTLNGSIVSDTSFTFNEAGTYTIRAVDMQDNYTQKTIKIDTTAPVITNVNNGDVVKKFTKNISVTDDNLMKVTLNGADVTSSASNITITEPNKYTLVAEDYAGNSSSVSFVYDAAGPKVNVIDKAYYNTQGGLKLSISSICGIKEATLQKVGGSTVSAKDGMVVTVDGQYKLKVTDTLGNSVSTTFYYDKTAPTVTNVKNGKYYKDGSKLNSSIKIKDNIKLDTDKSYTMKGSVRTDGTRVNCREDGKYQMFIYDMAGNLTQLKFTVDSKAPTCNIKAGKKYKKGKKIIFKDKGSGIKKATLNGKKIKNKAKLKKNGKNTLIITDKAGNKLKVKFKVK